MEPTPAPVRVAPRAVGSPRTRAEYRWLAAGVGLSDLFAILLAFGLAYALRFGFEPSAFDFLAVALLAPPLWLMIFAAFKLYALSRLAPAEEVRRIVYAVTVGITVIVTVSYWTKAELSRQWVATSWVLALVFILLTRRVWRGVVSRSRTRGMLTFRTVILGTNDEAAHLADVMQGQPVGFEPVGFVRARHDDPLRVARFGLPVEELGSLRDLLGSTGADCIYVASSASGTSAMRTVGRLSREQGVEVRVSVNIPSMLPSRLAAQPLGGLMGFSLWPVRLTGVQAAAKRGFDLVSGAILLVLTSPVLLAAAIAVKLDSKGPVLYRQVRVGHAGQEFVVLKFRTMVDGADAIAPEANEASGPLFKVRRDPRLTPVGRRLRRWSIDELPQLFNVLRGQMSLVGPRPPLPAEVAAYEDWHRDRLEVRPGITGLWQVSGRSELSFDDYVRLDLFYIENWSLAFDVYLLAKTVPAVLSGRGAY